MRICYKNLEGLIYQKDRGRWYKILSKKYNYKYDKEQRHDQDKAYSIRKYYDIKVCPICDNDFLSAVYNPSISCSYECAHYLRINKRKYTDILRAFQF